MEDEGHHLKSNVVPFRNVQERIQPPSDLTAEELQIFSKIIRSYAPSHFAERDRPLLIAYCGAVNLAALYARHTGDDVARRMSRQVAKLVAVLGDRLRLGSRDFRPER
jgi:hypothetical protein